jgi:hypothetical protein
MKQIRNLVLKLLEECDKDIKEKCLSKTGIYTFIMEEEREEGDEERRDVEYWELLSNPISEISSWQQLREIKKMRDKDEVRDFFNQ